LKKTLMFVLLLTSNLLLQLTGLHAQAASGQAATSASKNPQASLDSDAALLRQDVRSEKKQIIAANLELTDTEATRFWPVYDQYSAELTELGDQKYALIKEYAQGFGKLTDEQALSLIKRSLALDEQLAQLRSKYVTIFNKVLPGTKTATFFQMDRRIGALIDLQLAAQIPFVQEQN
jgi:phosphoglycolate phosphatase-like HAD superfamily hydrolase